MSDTDDDKHDDIVLAGEYALHLLDARERRAFEARLAKEPELRALLLEWDEGFVPFSEEIEPVAPPPRLKQQIEARLFATHVEMPAPLSWLNRILAGALAAAALAILLVTFVPLMQPAPPTAPAYQAQIAAEDGSLLVQARFDAGRNTLSIERLQGSPAQGRVLELWLIAAGADGPVSLGVLPEAPSAEVALSDTLAGSLEGGTLAISDEPPGGSPTGQPTGAVLAVGPVTTL